MVVGICRVNILLPESQSLKERRSTLRRLKDLVRRRFPVAIAEVEPEDLWQTATLGVVTVANERPFVESILERMLSFIDGEAKIASEDRDILHYGEGALSDEDYPHWEPDSPPPPIGELTQPSRKGVKSRKSKSGAAPALRPPSDQAELDAPCPWELTVEDDKPGDGGDEGEER